MKLFTRDRKIENITGRHQALTEAEREAIAPASQPCPHLAECRTGMRECACASMGQ